MNTWLDDETRIMREIDAAEAEGREISDACARMIAAMFHSGQTTLGYAFSSSGVMPDYDAEPDTIDAEEPATALWRDLFPDYAGLASYDRRKADYFGTYLHNIRSSRPSGPIEGWSDLWR